MAKKTIPELDDGTALQTSAAIVAFEQGGQTFFGPVRPNPARRINVRNQAQLEAELGVGLEIADGESLTIALDDAFTLTNPIRLGLNSSLQIFQSTNSAFLTYTGTGALFQNTNPANIVGPLTIRNIQITGDGTNSLFDLVGDNIVEAKDCVFSSFASLGRIENPFILFNSVSLVNLVQGLLMVNPSDVSITISNIIQVGPTGMTAFTVFTNAVTNSDFNIIRAASFFTGDSLFFFDPNAPTGSIYTVERSSVTAGDFYQVGPDIAINSVADNGGIAQFTTAVAHDLVVGKAVVLSGFGVETTYNGTFIVTAIPTTTTFDVDENFAGDDSGNMNESSLDSTDTLVIATANIGSPDSRFTGDSGLEVFGAEVISSNLVQDAFEVITSASWAFSNLERFIEGVVNTGQLVCDDRTSREYAVSYSATIEKTGPAGNLGVIILKNGTNVAFNPPHTVNTGKIQITGSDLIELTTGDTLDIAVINYDSTATPIDISQASLVVDLA